MFRLCILFIIVLKFSVSGAHVLAWNLSNNKVHNRKKVCQIIRVDKLLGLTQKIVTLV